MDLADYFERGSLLKTLRKRHPYDFVETYELLRHLYGYDKFYVNLGYWKDGLQTTEAGYELVRFLAGRMDLGTGSSLIDAGAGMGQAAVDLAKDYELRHITGININERQVRFANDLRDEASLGNTINHICGDASEVPHTLDKEAYDFAMAVECIGHFPSAERFLAGVSDALVPRGRMVFCLNIAKEKPSFFERLMMKISYGFIPQPAGVWTDRIAAAKFKVVDHGDITSTVLEPAMERSLAQLKEPSPATARVSGFRKWCIRKGCHSVLRAASGGRMAYQYFVIEKT